MGRLITHCGCDRPGCARPAGAAFALDPRRLIVWIGDLDTSGAGVNRLCVECADELRAPSGWVRQDIREAPRLFAVAPEPTPAAAAPRTRAPRARRARASTPAPAPLDANPPAPEAGELLQPSEATPLLARAFRAARAAG